MKEDHSNTLLRKQQPHAALPAGQRKGEEENEAQRRAKRLAVNHPLCQLLRAKLWHKILVTAW